MMSNRTAVERAERVVEALLHYQRKFQGHPYGEGMHAADAIPIAETLVEVVRAASSVSKFNHPTPESKATLRAALDRLEDLP